jgi:hypothetical protein
MRVLVSCKGASCQHDVMSAVAALRSAKFAVQAWAASRRLAAAWLSCCRAPSCQLSARPNEHGSNSTWLQPVLVPAPMYGVATQWGPDALH